VSFARCAFESGTDEAFEGVIIVVVAAPPDALEWPPDRAVEAFE
jgi:hypothetical protein